MSQPSQRIGPAKRRARLAAIASAALLAVASPAPGQDQAAAGAHPAPSEGGGGESEAAQKVTRRVLCMCGGCVNQTLHECTCGTAASERDDVEAAIRSGKTPEQITQAYVDRYGLQVLSSPDKVGFNLFGWSVPYLVAIGGVAGLSLVLRRWVRSAPAHAVSAAGAPPADPSEARYRERLERELREFEEGS